MGGKNKIVRQHSWLQSKATKGKQRIQERRDRRREEEKHPERKAERLAKNKPRTLEDKREYPTSEDYYARRKRRRVAVEKSAEKPAEKPAVAEEVEDEEAEEDMEVDEKDEVAETKGSKEGKKSQNGDDDSDIASLLGDSDDDEEMDEAGAPKPKMTSKERAAARHKAHNEKQVAAEAAARIAHEDAMAAKYSALLPTEPSAAGDEEEKEDKEAAIGGANPAGPAAAPRLLITTSRHATIHRHAQTLVDLFPNSTYIPRSGHRFVQHEYSLREIAGFAHNRGYTALLVLNEDQKKPTGLDVALLPQGPMLHFSIQTWVDAKHLPNHGRSTDHVPEVLLNNFDTPLGKLVGGVLGRLFPRAPELVGRQVVTLHNQRDYVFVRRHRYAVRDKRATERSVADKAGRPMAGVEDVKVALQEIGPRMTLKLRRVDKGLQRMSGQAFEWTGRMEKKRTVFQL